MQRIGTVAVMAGALVLTGCTSPAQEPPGLTASPTPHATSTPTPVETAPASLTPDPSDPELGILFEDVPYLTGDEADVWNVAAMFQREYWRTMTTNVASPGLGPIAGPEVLDLMDDVASTNGADGVDIGGTFRTRVWDVRVEGDRATTAACDDYREATFSDAGGPDTPETAGFADPRLKTLTLSKLPDGRWIVGATQRVGTC